MVPETISKKLRPMQNELLSWCSGNLVPRESGYEANAVRQNTNKIVTIADAMVLWTPSSYGVLIQKW